MKVSRLDWFERDVDSTYACACAQASDVETGEKHSARARLSKPEKRARVKTVTGCQ